MINKILIVFVFLCTISFFVYADYLLDSNKDGEADIWVEELEDDGVTISSDKNHDGIVDSKLAINGIKLTEFEETDYNFDGIMDNFYFYENGFVIRQEVDSNYDQKVDVWVYITNNGKSIYMYEKDLDFDGIIDKTKKFEVNKQDGK